LSLTSICDSRSRIVRGFEVLQSMQ
jgi:hypothetical protein